MTNLRRTKYAKKDLQLTQPQSTSDLHWERVNWSLVKSKVLHTLRKYSSEFLSDSESSMKQFNEEQESQRACDSLPILMTNKGQPRYHSLSANDLPFFRHGINKILKLWLLLTSCKLWPTEIIKRSCTQQQLWQCPESSGIFLKRFSNFYLLWPQMTFVSSWIWNTKRAKNFAVSF